MSSKDIEPVKQNGFSKRTKLIAVCALLGLGSIAYLNIANTDQRQEVAVREEETQETFVMTAGLALKGASIVSGLFGGSARAPWPDPAAKKKLEELAQGQEGILAEVGMTDKIVANEGYKLNKSIEGEHHETEQAITKMGAGINANIKDMRANVMKGFGEIAGVSLENRRILGAHMDENLRKTTEKLDQHTNKVVAEVKASTKAIIGKADEVESSIKGNLGSMKDNLSGQMTDIEGQIKDTLSNEIRDFQKELSQNMDSFRSEMGASFRQSEGNQAIMKQDLAALKQGMMKTLDFGRQAHFGRQQLLELVNTYEQAFTDLQASAAATNMSVKKHNMKKLKDRVTKTQHKITDAKAYLKPNMIEENISSVKAENPYEAAKQIQSYMGLIMYVHALETMRISFQLDDKVPRTVVINQLDRADADRDTSFKGIEGATAKHLTLATVNDQTGGAGPAYEKMWAGKMFKDKKKIFAVAKGKATHDQILDACAEKVTADSGCHHQAFTIYHDSKTGTSMCYCFKVGGSKTTISDKRVATYKMSAGGSGGAGFTMQAGLCGGFALPDASARILAMCSNYHKIAQEKYLAAREMCSSKMPFFQAVLKYHYDNNMKHRDETSCGLSDGPTVHYCACVKPDQACHILTNFDKSGQATSVKWICEQ